MGLALIFSQKSKLYMMTAAEAWLLAGKAALAYGQ